MLPERLREARQRAGLRQIDLAAAIGEYDHSVISAIETGRCSMALKPLVKAADALSVSTDYLLGRTDVPETAHADGSEKAAEAAKRTHAITDVRLGRTMAAIIQHYEQLNEYGRNAFLHDLHKQFPSVPWQGQRSGASSNSSAGA